jgi:hypothetical protein
VLGVKCATDFSVCAGHITQYYIYLFLVWILIFRKLDMFLSYHQDTPYENQICLQGNLQHEKGTRQSLPLFFLLGYTIMMSF